MKSDSMKKKTFLVLSLFVSVTFLSFAIEGEARHKISQKSKPDEVEKPTAAFGDPLSYYICNNVYYTYMMKK